MADRNSSPPLKDASAKQRTSIPKDRMAVLFMVMLVTAAGNTAMQSVMPSIGTALGVADVWISLAYSWSALLWVGTAPYWAARSDRRGRKAMMALGMTGFIASFALCGAVLWFGLQGLLGATATLLLFAAFRSFYGGLGSAAPPAVQAYVASRTPRADRTRVLALIASSFGLGTVIGPAIAPLLIFPVVGLTGPFIAAALIGIAMLIALRMRLPNDDPTYAARGRVVAAPFSAASNSSLRQDEDDAEDRAFDSVPEADPPKLSWRDRRLRPWIVAGLVGGHAQAAILGIIGFLILDRLGLRATPELGAAPTGLVLMSGAFATLVAQWGLIPTLDLGPRASTLWGVGLALIGVIVVAVADDLHAIALGFSVASLGFGLFRPGFTSGSSLAVSRTEQGQVAGIVASTNGAAYIVAPALGVWLYNQHVWLGFGAIVALCLAVLLLGWRSMEPDEKLVAGR